MASKPTVTLTFAGDSDKLSKAFKSVGSSAEEMGKKLKDTDGPIRDSASSMESLTDKADGAEQRAMGFRDTITGLQDSFKGIMDPSLSFEERLLTLGMGIGDLASGFANLLIPAFSKFGAYLASTTVGTWAISAAQTAWTAVTTGVTAATHALNAAMRANPILFIVGLIAVLVTAFVLLWNNSASFRNFFIGMWNGIKSVIGGVVNWIVGAFNGMVSFFAGIPSRIGAALAGIGGFFKNAFKGAANLAIDAVNWMIDQINKLIAGVNHINPFDDIPGIPKLRRLHTGGEVTGAMAGQEVLRVLQVGERVVPKGQGGGGGSTITFAGDTDGAFATAFMKLVRTGVIRIS